MGLLDNRHRWWRQGPEQGDDDGLFNLNPAKARRAKLTVVLLLAGLVLLVSNAPERKPTDESQAEPALVPAPEKLVRFPDPPERSLAEALAQIAGWGR